MKKIKGLISTVLAFAMLFNMLVFTASAAEEPNVELRLVRQNGTYQAVVHVNDPTLTLTSAQVFLVYDSSVVKLGTHKWFNPSFMDTPSLAEKPTVGNYVGQDYAAFFLTGGELMTNVDLLTVPFEFQAGKTANDVKRSTIRIETNPSSDMMKALNSTSAAASLYLGGKRGDTTGLEYFIGDKHNPTVKTIQYTFAPDTSVFPHANDYEIRSITLEELNTPVVVEGSKVETDYTVDLNPVVTDTDNNEVSSPTLSWTFNPGTTGATINETTGIITIPRMAQAGTITVSAKDGRAGGTMTSNTVTITVTREAAALSQVKFNPEEVQISGYNDNSSTQTVQATAYDQYDAPYAGTVTWSKGDVELFSTDTLNTDIEINASTGVITVGNAVNQANYEFIATDTVDSTKTASGDLTVTRVDQLSGNQGKLTFTPDTFTIAYPTTISYTLTNQFGEAVTGDIQWNTPAGITISGNTVTVADTVAPGKYTITATCGNVTASQEVTVQTKPIMIISGPTIADKVYDGTALEVDLSAAITGKPQYPEGSTTIIPLSAEHYKGTVYTQAGNVVDPADVVDANTYRVAVTYETAEYIGVWEKEFKITPATLTVGSVTAENREYDGTVDVEVTADKNSISGIVPGDENDVQVVLTGVADSKNAGRNKNVTVTGALTGAKQKNYVLGSFPTSTTVTIDPAVIDVTITVADKVYDGTTAAAITSVQLTDTKTELAYTSSTVEFDDPDAGEDKTLTGSVTLAGTFADNYEIRTPPTIEPATITPADYTVTLNRNSIAIRKGFELDPIAEATPNLVGGESIEGTLTFTDKSGKEMTGEEIAKLNVSETPYALTWTYTLPEDDTDAQNYTTEPKTGTFLLTVTDKAPQNIELSFPTGTSAVMTYGDADFTLDWDVTSFNEDGGSEPVANGGAITWESDNEDIIAIDEDTGLAEIRGVGTVVLTATAAATDTYAEGTQTVTITVKPMEIELRVDDDTITYGDTFQGVGFKSTRPSGLDPEDVGFTAIVPSGTLDAGEYAISGVISNPNYTATIIPGILTVNPRTHDDITVPLQVSASTKATGKQTLEINLPITDITGAVPGAPAITNINSAMVISATIEGNTLKVEYDPQNEDEKSTITIPVTSKNYKQFNIIYNLTAVGKENISDSWQFVFNDDTCLYDGKPHSLTGTATYNGSAENFVYYPDASFTEPGVYTFVAVYSDDNYYGTKTATLTITERFEVDVDDTPTIDEDENQGNYTVSAANNQDGSIAITITQRGALRSYLRPGDTEPHQWVPVLFTTQRNGAALTAGQLFISETDEDGPYTRIDDVIVDGGQTYFVYWMPVDEGKTKKLWIANDALGTSKAQVTISYVIPSTNDRVPSYNSGSSASHSIRPNGAVSTTTKYTISKSRTSNGSFTVSASSAESGDKITITIDPDSGYVVEDVEVTRDDTDRSVSTREDRENVYSFTMPAADVTVAVTFTADGSEPEPEPVARAASFSDVSSSDWFVNAVNYVSANSLMAGNNGRFSPNDRLTRGMMAQILYNMEGASGSGSRAFPDVTANDWFATAVGWASSQSYMDGYGNGNFGPNDPITREQVAAILYRYTQAKAPSAASASGSLSGFTDGASTSDWAQTAVAWAVGSGLISGKSGNRLDPTGTATRAEIAQILMGFHQNILK